MGAPEARVLPTGDRLDLLWPDLAAWNDLNASCVLRDGTVCRSSGWSAVPGAAGRYATTCGPLLLEIQLEALDGRVSAVVEARTKAPSDVLQVALAGRPELAGREPGWVLYNGYQSWDAAGHLRVDGRARESWWTIGLMDAAGAGIVAAAAGARTCCTKFTVADGRLGAVWCEAEGVGTRRSLFAGPSGTTWRGETAILAAGADARCCLGTLVTGGVHGPMVPVGWLSWYHFGPLVLREEVLANAGLLAGPEFEPLGYRVVQLDDGWQQTYGEWVPNTRFVGGLSALCEDLRKRGQIPGLWTAPFLVSPGADLAREGPDSWFARDVQTGELIVDERHRAFGPMHVLDASVPAVQDHLRALFADFYEAGIRYFKVDFVYAGAYAGIGALRAGLEAIREGVRDAQLMVSGAPLLAVVGLAEGCRVGPDTATPMLDFEAGACRPTVFGDEVIAVARNAAARSMLHRWFHLDADVALVGGNLTLEQGRQLVTVAALSGGPFFASDDLCTLPPDRLALLTNPEVMDLVGGGPAVPDWEPNGSDLPPSHWRRGDVLAVFNWCAEPVEMAVRAPSARGARDLWGRREVEGFADGMILEIPGHGVRLLRTR